MLAWRTDVLSLVLPQFLKHEPLLSKLSLKTHKLAEVRDFYKNVIGLSVIAETASAVSFRAGLTTLEFEQVTDGSKPYYHFAFNIPENKHDKAKAWLATRAKPIIDSVTKLDYVYFPPPFNMHSVYFHDPADNIVEFCCRHDMPNRADGPFTSSDILYASEIAVSAADYLAVIPELKSALNLASYHLDHFLGDEYGLVLVFPKDRLWIPERKQPGLVNQTKILLSGKEKLHYHAKDNPFEFAGTR